MDKEEVEARIKDIEIKIKNLAAWAYADGHEAGIGIGMKNQDEVQYKHGYEQGVRDTERNYNSDSKDALINAVINEDWENVPERLNTALESSKNAWFQHGKDEGYSKGLEDMWDVWHWYSHASASDVHSLFPEVLKEGYTYFVDVVEKIGLAESVHRIKKDMKADAQILYSTISDLKADYTKEQIIKALKDNGIEIIEVEHE